MTVAPVESSVSASAGAAERSQGVPLRAALWGATGAAGSEVLRQCLAEPRIGEIVAFTRRPLACDGSAGARVKQVYVDDFLDMTPHSRALRHIDVVFWCVGVSQLTEPNPQAYRVITRDFAVAAAEVIRRESPHATFHFLSGLGSARNGLSPVMWGRAKGEAEKALAGVGLRRLVVWRPTFIHAVTKREHPTRGDRMAELFYLRAIPLLTNSTVDIAQAMLHTSFDHDHDHDHDHDSTYGPWGIIRIARAYRRSLEQVQ